MAALSGREKLFIPKRSLENFMPRILRGGSFQKASSDQAFYLGPIPWGKPVFCVIELLLPPLARKSITAFFLGLMRPTSVSGFSSGFPRKVRIATVSINFLFSIPPLLQIYGSKIIYDNPIRRKKCSQTY